MKKTLLIVYLAMGLVISGWYTAAAVLGWKSPNLGIAKALQGSGSSSGGYYGGGRSFGGSWGGGK
ncbi:hypothetical protein Mal15_40740 [Stieleria maiorica]|uniref:Uncharacterized protein n=1 Tax=Stieleria maiorica TaxID=2795974 RepID=A0A5B9MK51_9BACT|nr:hypothetical protein [Stieleria maiorica]QEG00006.1 hypothetical protein Mal15_40740 [Stieleria maiorica]